MTQTPLNRFEVYEAIAAEVCGLNRLSLIERLINFDGDMPLDFSADYLSGCSTDQIRHLLVAALWRCQMKRFDAMTNDEGRMPR